MQTLLLPTARAGLYTSASPPPLSASAPFASNLHRFSFRPKLPIPRDSSSDSLLKFKTFRCLSSPFGAPKDGGISLPVAETKAYASSSSTPVASANDDSEKAKLAQVAKRLESTSRYFKRLGSLGFWGQLVCTVVAAVILSFSVVVTGRVTSPATFYATAGGVAAAFISVFWSFGYIRLSEKLRKTANAPSKAPPRADVVKSLKNGIVLNLLGMGAAILGMQATVGLLVAKALTTSANPYYQGIPPGSSPVLALDVFLVQASANTILSHFLGLVFSLELLRSVTLPPQEGVPIPKLA